MFKKCVMLFICILSTTSDACCMCMPRDSQYSLRVFCSAHLVAEVTVTNTTLYEHYYEYTINYTTVYKMLLDFNETFPTKIYSDKHLTACGMILDENVETFVVGYVNNDESERLPLGEIYVDSCSYLDEEFKNILRNNVTTVDCSELKEPVIEYDELGRPIVN